MSSIFSKVLNCAITLNLLFSTLLFAEDMIYDEEAINRKIYQHSEKYHDSYSYPSAPSIESLSTENLEKAERLYALVHHQMQVDDLSVEKMRAVVNFIESIALELAWDLKSSSSVFIHADDRLPLSIIFYRSGRTYILLENHDPQKKAGAFKKYSRSIEYKSEKIYGHLASVLEESKWPKIRLEVRALHRFRNSQALASLEDSDVFVDNKTKTHLALAIEMQAYDGDLHDLIPKLTVPESLELFIAMAEALKELHTLGYVHRDIKPENFLYRKKDNHFEVVLSDFGLVQSPHSKDLGSPYCGTGGYIDPSECVAYAVSHGKQCFRTIEEGKNADIFALGVSFFYMLHGANELQKRTQTLNKMIFLLNPQSGKVKICEYEIKQEYERFRRFHQYIFSKAPGQNSKEKLVLNLHNLIKDMTEPCRYRRTKLAEIIRSLHDLKAEVFTLELEEN